jgi:hypothetical protein
MRGGAARRPGDCSEGSAPCQRAVERRREARTSCRRRAAIDRPGTDRYDELVNPADAGVPRMPHCPTCRSVISWEGNPHRPFCSLSCRLIDLGVWFDERYRVPGEPVPSESSADDRVPPGG